MRKLILFIFISSHAFQVKAGFRTLKAEKEPAWITVNNVDYGTKAFDKEAEDGYLDMVFEKQVSLEQQSCYYKEAYKIVSEAGVENKSDISVVFDPAYEQLTFHSIRIIRDGVSINRLQLSKFKTIQQEKDLNRHMYDGSLTALLVLDDVRKGDVVESSYTIKGFNPALNNKYTDKYGLQFEVPVTFLYYKLIVPKNRSIQRKNYFTALQPVITYSANQSVYEWKATNVSALHLESKTPGWFNPHPRIRISEYETWHEVSAWANTLFPRDIEPSTALRKEIDKIKSENQNADGRVVAALHFVQDDIRYMGIEMGESSHKPNSPNQVFLQRYGDCKDKSYLLVTMLKEMGIEADPVLINTINKNAIKDWLPSYSAFDHCTVQVRLNGKTYWFDPTISFQRGTINDITYPDYQVGLVVNQLTTGLTAIPFHDPGSTYTKEIFDLADMSGMAKLKVITTRTGSYADDTRFDFSDRSNYEIRNKYKDFYATYFDKITVDSLTSYSDDKTGTFVTTEYYTLNNIWKIEDGKKTIPISAYIIGNTMTKPPDKNRMMPFYLSYPSRNKEEIEINMPEDWPIKSFEERVQCPSFEFYAKGEAIGNKIILNYAYENLKDHVMPDDASVFFTNYDYAYSSTGFQLSYTPNQPSTYKSSHSGLPSLGLFPKLYILLGLAVVITFMVRRQKQKGY